MTGLDWDKIRWIKPDNSAILKYSRGERIHQYVPCCYEHLNWAFKVSGHNRVVCTHSALSSEDFAILVGICQELVERDGIVEEVVQPVDLKKSWWRI